MLTTAFAQALRDHVSGQDRPLAALAGVARSISDLLAEEGEQAASVHGELAMALRAAVETLWVEYGGDPNQLPDASGAAH